MDSNLGWGLYFDQHAFTASHVLLWTNSYSTLVSCPLGNFTSQPNSCALWGTAHLQSVTQGCLSGYVASTMQCLTQGLYICALQTCVEGSNGLECGSCHQSHSRNWGWLDSERCDTGWPPFSPTLVALAHAGVAEGHCSSGCSSILQEFGMERRLWITGCLDFWWFLLLC